MLQIPLLAIPKQEFFIVLNDVLWEFTFLQTGGCMCFNADRAGADVIDGQRLVAGQLLIPFKYLEAAQGNLIFLTANNYAPWYENFGIDQNLYYAADAELEAVRNGFI